MDKVVNPGQAPESDSESSGSRSRSRSRSGLKRDRNFLRNVLAVKRQSSDLEYESDTESSGSRFRSSLKKPRDVVAVKPPEPEPKPELEPETETGSKGEREREYPRVKPKALPLDHKDYHWLRDLGADYISDGEGEEVEEEVFDERNPRCKAGKCGICNRSYSHTELGCPYLRKVPHKASLPDGVDKYCYCCGYKDGHKNTLNWIAYALKRWCSICKVEYDHWSPDCPTVDKPCCICKSNDHRMHNCPDNHDLSSGEDEYFSKLSPVSDD